jgi:hypothetical protein
VYEPITLKIDRAYGEGNYRSYTINFLGRLISSPPLVEQEDIDRLLAAASKYGVEIKPPPEP